MRGLNTNQIYFWDIKGIDQFHDLQTLKTHRWFCVSQKLCFFVLFLRKHELLNFGEACFKFLLLEICLKKRWKSGGLFFRHWKFGSPHPLPNPPNPSGIPEGVSLFPDEEEDVEKLYLGTSPLLRKGVGKVVSMVSGQSPVVMKFHDRSSSMFWWGFDEWDEFLKDRNDDDRSIWVWRQITLALVVVSIFFVVYLQLFEENSSHVNHLT